jgi:hypothetical protein
LTSRARYLPTASGHVPPVLFVAILIAAAWALQGCSLFSERTFDDYVETGGTPRRKKGPVNVEEEMVFSHPVAPPAWAFAGVTKAQAGGGDYHFTGVSKRFTTEQDARMDSLRDAREQIAAYMVTDVKKEVQRVTVTKGRSSQILDPSTVQNEVAQLLSATTLIGTASTEYYIQRWVRREDGIESVYWKAYSLVVFPEKQNREIRTAVLRSSAQRHIDRLEMLSESRALAKGFPARDFENRMQAVRRSMKDGRHIDAISQAQDLLDRLLPPEEKPPDRPATQPESQPSRTPVPPSTGWQSSRTKKQNEAKAAQAHVRNGLHATHLAMESLAGDQLVHARKLLVDARSEASTAAKKFKSPELRYQARVFDEFLKDSVEGKGGDPKADHQQSLRRLLQSYWRAAVDNNKCPRCGVTPATR